MSVWMCYSASCLSSRARLTSHPPGGGRAHPFLGGAVPPVAPSGSTVASQRTLVAPGPARVDAAVDTDPPSEGEERRPRGVGEEEVVDEGCVDHSVPGRGAVGREVEAVVR